MPPGSSPPWTPTSLRSGCARWTATCSRPPRWASLAQDASRQPQQYSLGGAEGAPRYPSNIYYNASNWPDELNEYSTLYVKQGVPLGDPAYPGDIGHCTDTADTTCLSQPATEASLLASETHIMLGHVLGNDPRVSYAHQSDLIGPATEGGQDYGYTILDLIDSMLSQYHDWFTTAAPLDQVTDVSDAQVLAEQAGLGRRAVQWQSDRDRDRRHRHHQQQRARRQGAGHGAGTMSSGGPAFGQPYGGDQSDWAGLGNGATLTLTAAQISFPDISPGSRILCFSP